MLKLDHFVLGVKDLKSETLAFCQLTGVTPALSGQHLTVGTHNALISLGKDLYFELLAPDLSLRPREEVGIEKLRTLEKPRLLNWMLSCADFDELEVVCQKIGITLSEIGSGSRKTLEGQQLQYEFARPTFESLPDFVSPWVIRWLSSPHPSTTSPEGCTLDTFSIQGRHSQQFKEFVKNVRAPITLQESDNWEIKIQLNSPKGQVKWTSYEK